MPRDPLDSIYRLVRYRSRDVKVLAVDDQAYSRRALKAIFESAGHDVTTAEDGRIAMEQARASRPDVIVTDILMPGLDGFQLCRAIKRDPALASIPVIFYTGQYTGPDDRELGASVGASAYLVKPMEPQELIDAVAAVLGQSAPRLHPRSARQTSFAAAHAERLAAKLQEKIGELNRAYAELDKAYTGTVSALCLTLASREGTNPLEAERPARLAQLFLERVDPELAADPNVFRGFLLHDIGKLMLPDGLLAKEGALTDEERAMLRNLPATAADILRHVPGLGSALDVVRCHHEWYDGSGFPEGRRGDQIPLAARIFAIADAFVAMVSERPYRPARKVAEAMAELRALAGRQFDPALVEPFLLMVEAM